PRPGARAGPRAGAGAGGAPDGAHSRGARGAHVPGLRAAHGRPRRLLHRGPRALRGPGLRVPDRQQRLEPTRLPAGLEDRGGDAVTYEPQEWRDGPAGGTPITAERLNHIEQGVKGVAADLDTRVPKAHVTLNVKDFGAVGDNVAADSPAFQAAVDHAASIGGATIYAPAGIYRIDVSIKWATGVSLVGDGPGKTILKQRGELVDAIYQADQDSYGDPDAVPLEDVTFRDFEIDGSA